MQSVSNPEYELMFCIPNSPFVHEVFHPEFNGKGVILHSFVHAVVNGVIDKSYTQRITFFAEQLNEFLPDDYTQAIDILMKILGEEKAAE